MASRWIRHGAGKRAIDLAIAVPALVLLAPVTLAVAVAVRVRLGSPVMFRQSRSGRGGTVITVPKFRSMTDSVDDSGQPMPDDQRLTPFGRRLRSTSLDELPQLWSVIRGHMSLVGPRPLPVAYFDRYTPEQRRRLEARPGITGWAQVNGRNATTWSERLTMDVWYVDRATPLIDLRILWRTLVVVSRRGEVSADGHATMPEFSGSE